MRAGKFTFSHPDVVETNAPEISEEGEKKEIYNTGRIYPIYPELNGISPGRFSKKTWELVSRAEDYFHEYLPEAFIEKFELLGVVETIKNMHYPETMELQRKAVLRIFFDRLLRVQLHALMNKAAYQANYLVE
jgi:ATP-dependent DNA helicase RecG